MAFDATVIADSVSPSGSRLTTFEVTFPRFILAEMNTHRDFSRSSASSRAIPTKKIIERIKNDPFEPIWTANQSGMQGGALTAEQIRICQNEWNFARAESIKAAEGMMMNGAHKQNINRVLEPYMWHTAIITASRWKNFFAQRCHPDAQPEMQHIAKLMLHEYTTVVPNELGEGNWHLPYIEEEDIAEFPVQQLLQLSVARCARVSYKTHDGVRDPDSDIKLFKRLYEAKPPHASPFEHVAMAVYDSEPREYKNFDPGWIQFRSLLPNEYVS